MSVRLMSVRLMDPRVGLFLGLFFAALALPAFAPATARAALAPDTAGPVSVTILHSFNDGSATTDSVNPAALIQGTDGNFYGTTFYGGSTANSQNAGNGTAFVMTPAGTVTILHNFGDGSVANDGQLPVAGLVQGTDGNFYGTTVTGGSASKGTVFKMTPAGTVTILHNFGDGSVANDGSMPYAALVQGTDGNFYGTTYEGGAHNAGDPDTSGYGTVFKITSGGTVTILHSFGYLAYPQDSLVQGTDGNFYGTTYGGGSGGSVGEGTVFKMTPAGTVTILHSFGDGSVPNDGFSPIAGLVQGTDGNFYGTAASGGSTYGSGGPDGFGYGTVYRITPGGNVTILHNFGDGSVPNDGTSPGSGDLIQGIDGNFYGSTVYGGSTVAADPNGYGYGTAFEMTPAGAVTILHNFGDGSVPNDGSAPGTTLVQGIDGNFYGTTILGGSSGNGTVFRLSLTPTITSISPISGNIGTVVTITGTNLLGTTNVLFQNANAMIYTVYSATRIAATVPSGAGTGTITVTTSGGSATSIQTFTVTGSLPTITSFTPTSGPVGTSVTITGTGFTGATSVKFNGTAAATYTVVSATSIAATVPSGATTGAITVTTPGGTATSSTSFTVTVPAPTITSFTPTSGPVGTTVVITGTNLTAATVVGFIDRHASFTVNSSTQITTTVPAGAATGIIAVATPGGEAKSAASFTVTSSLPTITSFTPPSGPVGTMVVITGTNLTGATVVGFTNAHATSFTVNSSTQITTSVPSGAITGPVAVLTPGGEAKSATSFTVTVPAPTITSFTPTSGPVGTTVVITGTNLTAATVVGFIDRHASFTVNSSTQITTTVPAGAATGIIAVATPGGEAKSAASFTVTSSLPTITSFTPPSGPVGTMVVITGTNFTGATVLGFTGRHAAFTVNSPTQITTTEPLGAATGPVAVATPAGTAKSSASFTITP